MLIRKRNNYNQQQTSSSITRHATCTVSEEENLNFLTKHDFVAWLPHAHLSCTCLPGPSVPGPTLPVPSFPGKSKMFEND